jgi:DNA-binding NarL/FixJ family response regulator
VRVVLADSTGLVRSGLARLLRDAGHDVIRQTANADELASSVARDAPDAVICDIRMLPSHHGDGLAAVSRLRARHPATAVVVNSHNVELRFAEQLLTDKPAGVAYLLKERVSDIAVLVDTLQRATEGEWVLGPGIVSQLMLRSQMDSPLDALTAREAETLASMAEGRSNAGIAKQLGISERTVESMCAQVFHKLGLAPSADDNRRVLAVLMLFRGT